MHTLAKARGRGGERTLEVLNEVFYPLLAASPQKYISYPLNHLPESRYNVEFINSRAVDLAIDSLKNVT
ncbi:hypothetical protein [Candidatus Regiella endosymbiont of Tuberolachnus salignus]|uniref:hypothetical protein n=1 Tax=Candidatus Regiella endosymbiont of Tuberolachnus salignus TaxID=3077956 RepID=UPI0030D5E1F9